MANAEQVAIGKLDGRDPDNPNYVALPYTGVSLYKAWDFGQNLADRPAGADPGKKPGDQWWTTSHLDKVTVLSEILTKKYHGQTLFHMVSALFAVIIEGEDPSKIAALLGVNRKTS